MIIATFTSSDKTIICCREEDEEIKIRTIDSRILYENPDKLAGRFYSLISNLFGIITLPTNTTLVFVVSGSVDTDKAEIIESEIINRISSEKLFDGFNFRNAFTKEKKGDEAILVFNDADALAFSFNNSREYDTPLPALTINIGKSVGVSIIKESGTVNYQTSVRPIKRLNGRTASFLLCDRGIDKTMLENGVDIFEEYTLNLVEVIKDIVNIGVDDGFVFRSVLISSNRSEFILEEVVKKRLSKMKVSILDAYSFQNKKIFTSLFNGLLLWNGKPIRPNKHPYEFEITWEVSKETQSKLLLNNEIVKIKYHASSGEEILTFNKFQDFVEHWKGAKPIVYGENYYKLYFNDKTNIKVNIDSLNSISDLQRYRF